MEEIEKCRIKGEEKIHPLRFSKRKRKEGIRVTGTRVRRNGKRRYAKE